MSYTRHFKRSSFLSYFRASRACTHFNHPVMSLVMSLPRASITMIQSWKSSGVWRYELQLRVSQFSAVGLESGLLIVNQNQIVWVGQKEKRRKTTGTGRIYRGNSRTDSGGLLYSKKKNGRENDNDSRYDPGPLSLFLLSYLLMLLRPQGESWYWSEEADQTRSPGLTTANAFPIRHIFGSYILHLPTYSAMLCITTKAFCVTFLSQAMPYSK